MASARRPASESRTDEGASGEPFSSDQAEGPAVRGFLHRPADRPADGLVLTHGAGGNANAPLLVALARALAAAGVTVLRCDLPFRQDRPKGPPSPSRAARDRDGLRRALSELGELAPGRLFLGGLSYGGRQASLLAAEEPRVARALLLLSYPLHAPGRQGELRTAHFPRLSTPTLFAHGSLDPFGSLDHLNAARALIPAPTALVAIEGAGHGLGRGARDPRPAPDVVSRVVEEFVAFANANRGELP